MPRSPRLQIPDGLFHLTTRSNTGRLVFERDDERAEFLSVVDELVTRRRWSCRSYCLLSTHYHLLFLTPEPDLAAGMQWLNGRYAQWANYARRERGHVFEGRYGSTHVQSDGHAYEVHRYIALNPVRAGLVENPLDWRWSSLPALLGVREPEPFLDLDGALEQFGPTLVSARRQLRTFIWDGVKGDQA
jgi:REP-associated tyrosine transposase